MNFENWFTEEGRGNPLQEAKAGCYKTAFRLVWEASQRVADERIARVKDFMDEIRESALQEVEGFGLCGLSDEMLPPPSLADLEKAIS